MKRRISNPKTFCVVCGLLILVAGPGHLVAEPAPAAVSAFNVYVRGVELRLTQQHQSANGFLAPLPTPDEARMRQGELIVEQIPPSIGADLSGALLHHWRGSAFVPGATTADFERLMKDFNTYPKHFSPQVLQAKAIIQQDDHMQAWMRVRQKHVMTVVMDTTYDVTFGRLDAHHGYNISRSTQISEIGSPGTRSEHVLSRSEEHGFLWRQNTYWSYEERYGGLYIQVESVSLSRAIPTGLGWMLRPYVESVPRESLQFTLQSTCNALRKATAPQHE